MAAAMLHKEYGGRSPWFSIGGYSVAALTGVSRLMNNRHWMSDVVAGAAIGIGAVNLGYFITDKIFKDRGLNAGYEEPEFIYDSGRKHYVAELMFGRNVGARTAVSESRWGRFVDSEIMARFPEGLTVYTTAGQWRDRASNKIMREPSKVVQIVLPGHDDDMTRLNEIAETYKARFKQQSVITIVRPACVSF
jgi:hypothetical protein